MRTINEVIIILKFIMKVAHDNVVTATYCPHSFFTFELHTGYRLKSQLAEVIKPNTVSASYIQYASVLIAHQPAIYEPLLSGFPVGVVTLKAAVFNPLAVPVMIIAAVSPIPITIAVVPQDNVTPRHEIAGIFPRLKLVVEKVFISC